MYLHMSLEFRYLLHQELEEAKMTIKFLMKDLNPGFHVQSL